MLSSELVHATKEFSDDLDLDYAWPRRSPLIQFILGDLDYPDCRCFVWMLSFKTTKKRKRMNWKIDEAVELEERVLAWSFEELENHVTSIVQCDKENKDSERPSIETAWKCLVQIAQIFSVVAKKPLKNICDKPDFSRMSFSSYGSVYANKLWPAVPPTHDPDNNVAACYCKFRLKGIPQIASTALGFCAMSMDLFSSRFVLSNLYPGRSISFKIIVSRLLKEHVDIEIVKASILKNDCFPHMDCHFSKDLIGSDKTVPLELFVPCRQHCLELAHALERMYEKFSDKYGMNYAMVIMGVALEMFSPSLDTAIYTSDLGVQFLPNFASITKFDDDAYARAHASAVFGHLPAQSLVRKKIYDVCASRAAVFLESCFKEASFPVPAFLRYHISCAIAYGKRWLTQPFSPVAVNPTVSENVRNPEGYQELSERYGREVLRLSGTVLRRDVSLGQTAIPIAIASRCSETFDIEIAAPDAVVALTLATNAFRHHRGRIAVGTSFIFVGEEGSGPGVNLELIDLYFNSLIHHTAFSYDDTCGLLKPSQSTATCPECSKLDGKTFALYNSAILIWRSAPQFRSEAAFRSVASESYNGPTFKRPRMCMVDKQVFWFMVQLAILEKYCIPYLIHPCMLTTVDTLMLDALYLSKAPEVTTLLETTSDEKLASYDVGVNRVEHVYHHLLKETKLMDKTFLSESASLPSLLKSTKPQALMMLLSGRLYGSLPPLQSFWSDAELVLGLFHLSPKSVEPMTFLTESVDENLFTLQVEDKDWSTNSHVVFKKEFFEHIRNLKEMAASADQKDQESMENIVLMKKSAERMEVCLRQAWTKAAFHNLCYWITSSPPEKRAEFYYAVTSTRCVTSRVVGELEKLRSNMKALIKTNISIVKYNNAHRNDIIWNHRPLVTHSIEIQISQSFANRSLHHAVVEVCVDCHEPLDIEQSRGLRLPSCSTCAQMLVLPPTQVSYEDFAKSMDIFLENSGTFGLV